MQSLKQAESSKVEEGMVLDIEKLSHETGDKVVFDQVKLIGGDIVLSLARKIPLNVPLKLRWLIM